MRDQISELTDLDQERRSGLPGLGGRPKMHPSWDKGSHESAAFTPIVRASEAATSIGSAPSKVQS
ncbi:MAG: hypothetical protein ACR2QJ_01795 [Geminicoccaceae bacterium]